MIQIRSIRVLSESLYYIYLNANIHNSKELLCFNFLLTHQISCVCFFRYTHHHKNSIPWWQAYLIIAISQFTHKFWQIITFPITFSRRTGHLSYFMPDILGTLGTLGTLGRVVWYGVRQLTVLMFPSFQLCALYVDMLDGRLYGPMVFRIEINWDKLYQTKLWQKIIYKLGQAQYKIG